MQSNKTSQQLMILTKNHLIKKPFSKTMLSILLEMALQTEAGTQ